MPCGGKKDDLRDRRARPPTPDGIRLQGCVAHTYVADAVPFLKLGRGPGARTFPALDEEADDGRTFSLRRCKWMNPPPLVGAGRLVVPLMPRLHRDCCLATSTSGGSTHAHYTTGGPGKRNR